MLVHRLRRWANIEPTMEQCVVLAGLNELSTPVCFTHEGGERPMSLKLQNQLNAKHRTAGFSFLIKWGK